MSSRVFYNSSFQNKNLFQDKVVYNLKKLHSKARASYSDVVKSDIPNRPVQRKCASNTTAVVSNKVLDVNTVHSVSRSDRNSVNSGT